MPLFVQCIDTPNTNGELFPYIVVEAISPIISFKIVGKTRELGMGKHFLKLEYM